MKMTKFEKFFVNSEGRSQRVAEYAEKMLRLTGFAPGQRYLDFGCGNGAAAVRLASKLGLNVTGIDVDAEQIDAAREKSGKNPKPPVFYCRWNPLALWRQRIRFRRHTHGNAPHP